MRASRSENSRRSGKVSTQLLTGAVLLAGAALLLGPINRIRSELQLRANDTISENLPPDIALTQAGLGTFRALATSVLWNRATRLQREGRNFEAMRLADWITRLQPRFSAVWSFQAWNMAFNISQTTDLPTEHWLWIREGVALLRDRGIPLNPREIDLYRELSHIFLRKLSSPGDELHPYYQREFAKRWHELLGSPPTGDAKEMSDWFRPVAEAYRAYMSRPGEPLERFQQAVPRAAVLLEQLETLGVEPGIELLRKVSVGDPGRLGQWLARNKATAEYAKLLAFLRARALAKNYNMDPGWMLKLLEGEWSGAEAGEEIPLRLDWRLPEAHCIYWASLGIHRGLKLLRPDEYASFYCDSNLLNALSLLKDNGRLVFDSAGEVYRRLPAPEFMPSLIKALKNSARKYPDAYPQTEPPPPAGPGR